MRVAITGASGLVGTRTVAWFRARGHEVVPLVRGKAAAGCASWDPTTGEIDIAALGSIDAVVHLAGETVAGRWSNRKKQGIADSRGPVTKRLCRTLAALPYRPSVLVCASAIGIYGDRGDEELDEQSPLGPGFLAEVCRAWEGATGPASEAGIRVVNLRIGLVLDRNGGALPRMLLPFKLGLGGRLGSGRQWMSWIALDDLVATIAFAIDREELRGPVLAVSPRPVTNREFTKALGRAIRRPTFLPAPAFALRLLLGEMADGLLLSGQRAIPGKLTAAGFAFEHTGLEPTLRTLLS